jgi:formylglycine-generating enzyme required for sulfatase activity
MALLLLLAVLWQGPRWFNALFPGVDGAPPTSPITPTAAIALADQTSIHDETATTQMQAQTAEATTLQTGATFTNSQDGAIYIWVPPGEFTMGSGHEDKRARDNEKPQHTVEVDGFWMMQTEVTNAQYQRCMKAGVCTEPNNTFWNAARYAEHPVTHVDWNQATTYAQWVGGRLPTEAEWEKACRGTEGRMYPWGDQKPNDQLLNYNSSVGDTTPVRSYPAGAYGFYDMVGNVWEWTSSLSMDYPYQADDGREDPESGEVRSLHGGSWGNLGVINVRCAVRFRLVPDDWGIYIGFRVVRQETAKEN